MNRTTLGAVAVVLQLSTAWAADGGTENLRMRTERRLALHDGLRGGGFNVATIGALTRALPPKAVLSRLAFDSGSRALSFTLSTGAKADVEAVLAALLKVRACEAPVATETTGTCTVEQRLARARLKPGIDGKTVTYRPGEAEVLSQRLSEAQTEVPDAPGLAELDAQLADVALRNSVVGFKPTRSEPVTQGPVDVYSLALRGTAGFDGAASLMLDVQNLRRIVWVDGFELTDPKLKNGEWAVTFTIRARTFRYRVEEESKAQDLAQDTVARGDATYAAITRNPFGPDAPVFAGSAKIPDAKACRVQGKATPVGDLEMDALAVVYVGDTCAMLVDDQGGCHLLKSNERVPWLPGAKAVITPEAVTAVGYFIEPDGKPRKKVLTLKTAPVAKPPAWFSCTK